MAELRFEAPLASFENEEWNDHEDVDSISLDNSKSENGPVSKQLQHAIQNGTDAENFREACSGSLEDLVNSFDERISNCFCNFEEQVEKIAPVQIRSQEEIVNDCQMWWTITGNYGNILPINWSASYTQESQSKGVHLRDKQDHGYPDFYVSDEEELPQDFDMHSLIVASLHHEDEDKVETAEDVIRQIEHMLKDPSTEDDDEETPGVKEDEQHLKLKALLDKLPSYTKQELKDMTCEQLRELLVEYKHANKVLSELLATEQALQDELDYDKELKNSFISLLLAIQKKLKDTNCDHKKKKKLRNSGHGQRMMDVADPEGEEGSSFLTTVIPYYPQHGPPTSEQLQIYIKILEAISQDSSTVPALLTDYILKVLCPTH